MLAATRREAAEFVEAARQAVEERLREFELELEAENQQLGERIARERDEAIASIRTEADHEIARLNGLREDVIANLAHRVVELLLGEPEQGGPP